jgi:dCTP deaminase
VIWGNERLKDLLKNQMITNSDERLINPASINLRLGASFIRPVQGRAVKLGSRMPYETVKAREDGTVRIKPGEFMLATTMERVAIPVNSAAFVQGRSSIGRIGLMVQNAGFVDPGFNGHITLELKNDSPCAIILKPGYPVAQLIFMDAADVSGGYNGKYQNQIEATGSRMHLDNLKGGYE